MVRASNSFDISVAEILAKEFFQKSDVSTVDVASKQAIESMKAVNDLNWQQFVRINFLKKGEKQLAADRPMKDFESITVGQEMRRIKNHPKLSKLLDLPQMNMQVNLYSSVIHNLKGSDIKAVAMAASNIRELRVRPESSQKSDGSALNLVANEGQEKEAFAVVSGAYGGKWDEVFNDKTYGFPSFD